MRPGARKSAQRRKEKGNHSQPSEMLLKQTDFYKKLRMSDGQTGLLL